MEPPAHLLEFTQTNLAGFDSSHDFAHSQQVYHYATEIMKEVSVVDPEIVIYACFLHDLIDHKYPEGQEERRVRLVNYLHQTLGIQRTGILLHLIENISWSKRESSLPFPTPALETMRRVVQDADWLDALGERGLSRCLAYGYRVGGKEGLSQRVRDHLQEKLLLIRENLHFEVSRRIALPLHQVLVDFVELP